MQELIMVVLVMAACAAAAMTVGALAFAVAALIELMLESAEDDEEEKMKIVCTVQELVSIARGCERYRIAKGCSGCVMVGVCSKGDGYIEQFVGADDVIEYQPSKEKTEIARFVEEEETV